MSKLAMSPISAATLAARRSPRPGSSGRSRRQGPPAPGRLPWVAWPARFAARPTAARPSAAPTCSVGRRGRATDRRGARRCRPGPDQPVTGREVLGGQHRLDATGEAVGPAVLRRRGERLQLVAHAPARAFAAGHRSSIRRMVGAPRSSPATASAAGKVATRSARSRLRRRRSSREARSSSRVIARSSAASSPWGTSTRSRSKRSSAITQAMRAFSASSFFFAGLRRRATRSGFTGTTAKPASRSCSTSIP